LYIKYCITSLFIKNRPAIQRQSWPCRFSFEEQYIQLKRHEVLRVGSMNSPLNHSLSVRFLSARPIAINTHRRTEMSGKHWRIFTRRGSWRKLRARISRPSHRAAASAEPFRFRFISMYGDSCSHRPSGSVC